MMDGDTPFFTIGHSNRSIGEFTELPADRVDGKRDASRRAVNAYGRALGKRSTRNPITSTLAMLKMMPVMNAGAYVPNWS
jgi:hypothetical protein